MKSMTLFTFIVAHLSTLVTLSTTNTVLPLVINTWPFTNATTKAWQVINSKGSTAIDAVEAGCAQCEVDQCDGTVGWGGSPDENGETTLDAMIIDATTHDFGAVGALRRIKDAISVARKVMENTNHTLLVGDQATQFALSMGFRQTSLISNSSKQIYSDWRESQCQPNYWVNVLPNPTKQCGPYHPIKKPSTTTKLITTTTQIPQMISKSKVNNRNHDTIGMIVVDRKGAISAGTTTNGLSHKIPGRVGDSPIPGAGAYAEKDVGAAAGTGDGDIAMRFAPAYQVVANLRLGMDPTAAAKDAIARMAAYFPTSMLALIAVDARGSFGAACNGIEYFPFSVMNPALSEVTVYQVNCTNPIQPSPHFDNFVPY